MNAPHYIIDNVIKKYPFILESTYIFNYNLVFRAHTNNFNHFFRLWIRALRYAGYFKFFNMNWGVGNKQTLVFQCTHHNYVNTTKKQWSRVKCTFSFRIVKVTAKAISRTVTFTFNRMYWPPNNVPSLVSLSMRNIHLSI